MTRIKLASAKATSAITAGTASAEPRGTAITLGGKATAERKATIAAQQAEQQRKESEYAAAMSKCGADVEACTQGDVCRCGPQP